MIQQKKKPPLIFSGNRSPSLRVQKIPRKDNLLAEENKTTQKRKPIISQVKRIFSPLYPLFLLKKHYGQGLIIANYKVKIKR